LLNVSVLYASPPVKAEIAEDAAEVPVGELTQEPQSMGHKEAEW
jgi:hypothetical protein